MGVLPPDAAALGAFDVVVVAINESAMPEMLPPEAAAKACAIKSCFIYPLIIN
jgi:hypothetical protein